MATIHQTFLKDLAHKKDLLKTATGDLATAEGVANLQSALFARLVTTPGSLVHRPDYGVGIKSYQNGLNLLSKQREIATRIEANYSRDPRVEKVLGVGIIYDDLDPSKTIIKVRLKPIGLEAISMEFVPFSGA